MPQPEKTRSRRRLAAKALLFVAIGLVSFELLARAVFPGHRIAYYWAFHPVLGWSQVPGGKYHGDVDGERVWVQFNSAGFHDVEHTLERPPGVRRIVLIGDSFSEAVQVNLEDTFFRLLEGFLNGESPDRWEVINLGVGDFGTAQACLALENYGLAYDPDIVLVQIFPLNDICNNSIELHDLSGSDNDDLRPYFVERDGQLVLTSRQPMRSWLRRHVISYLTLEALVARLAGAARSDEQREADRRARAAELGFPADGLAPLFHTYATDADQHPAIQRAWHLTERILERVVRRCRDAGVAVLPVVIPWDRRVGEEWKTFAAGQPPPPMVQDYPEQRLTALFDRLGVPCLAMKPVFELRPDGFFPPRNGHLNPTAHRLTARAIHETLRREGLLSR